MEGFKPDRRADAGHGRREEEQDADSSRIAGERRGEARREWRGNGDPDENRAGREASERGDDPHV